MDGTKIGVNSLDEVRTQIDRLDREIIRLMAERGALVRQAARFKSSQAEVEAPRRVEQVIAGVRKLASDNGLPPEVADATYRAMISAFIAMESEEFHKGRRGE